MKVRSSDRLSRHETASTAREVGWSAISWVALMLISLVLFATLSCGGVRNRSEMANRIARVEGRPEDDARIAELRAEIRAVDKQVEKTIDSIQKKGTYWRLLGLKYMDYGMWGEALKAFDEAVSINPEHAALFYQRSLCAGRMALLAEDVETRLFYIDMAESGHRRALALDPRYTPAMYALAVILVFESDRPEEAITYLENFLTMERSDIPARFLLGRAYLDTGRGGDALSVYDEVIRMARVPEDKIRAEELYRRVTEGGNE